MNARKRSLSMTVFIYLHTVNFSRRARPRRPARPLLTPLQSASSYPPVRRCPDRSTRSGAHHPRHNRPMLQHEPAWCFEYSVQCEATVEFAWSFWINVKNWALDLDIDSVEIDGPFAAGTRGRTHSRSSGRIEWCIAEVRAGKAVIHFPLSGAVGRFAWTFEDAGGFTRITQRCTLQGENADAYAKAVAPGLEAGIPAGMKELCSAIEDSARSGNL